MDQQIQEAFVALTILQNCELAEAMGLTPAELERALTLSAAQVREGKVN